MGDVRRVLSDFSASADLHAPLGSHHYRQPPCVWWNEANMLQVSKAPPFPIVRPGQCLDHESPFAPNHSSDNALLKRVYLASDDRYRLINSTPSIKPNLGRKMQCLRINGGGCCSLICSALKTNLRNRSDTLSRVCFIRRRNYSQPSTIHGRVNMWRDWPTSSFAP